MVQPQGYELGIFYLFRLFGFMGQLYMTRHFQISKKQKHLVAPLKYIEVIFNYFKRCFMVQMKPTPIYSFIGLFMIYAQPIKVL